MDIEVIDAKKVAFGGHTYDSQLEADWAATLSKLGVEFIAHPGSLQLNDGDRYEPDFLLVNEDILLEVKGPHNDRLEKTVRASREFEKTILIGREGFVIAFDAELETAGLVWHNADVAGEEWVIVWSEGSGSLFAPIAGQPGLIFYSAERCLFDARKQGVSMAKAW